MPLTVDCFITLWLAVTDFDTEGHLLVSLLACLSVCLSASLFVCLPACLSIHLSVVCPSICHLPVRPSVCQPCLPACLSFHPSVGPSVVRPSICPPGCCFSVQPPVFLSVCLSVCQLVHLSLCSQLFNHRLEHNLAINRFPYLLSFNCRNQGVCPSSIKFTTVCGQDRSLSYKITCGKHEAMV